MKRIAFTFLLVLLIGLITVNASAIECGYVKCDLLNVRVSPNTKCEIIDQLPYGTKFDIVYTDNGWYNIRMQDGITGFVSAPYVSRNVVSSSAASSVASSVARDAHSYLGYRYVYGTAGPSTFDCSGFTSYLYKQYGVTLPRTSTSQGEYGIPVDKSNLMSGDIVCFSNRSDRRINHVGIYIGDGNFIHASTSVRGVVMDSLNSNYYTNHYICARRIL